MAPNPLLSARWQLGKLGGHSVSEAANQARSVCVKFMRWNFKNVKVFAGDNFYPAADASYKNLVWENLPFPDILLSMYTPAIVSLET